MSDAKPERVLYLLEIYGCTPPIYLIQEGLAMEPDVAEYAFDEARCPHDILGCDAVITEGDVDPHGIVTYVSQASMPDDWPFVGEVTLERYAAIFPKLAQSAPSDSDRSGVADETAKQAQP